MVQFLGPGLLFRTRPAHTGFAGINESRVDKGIRIVALLRKAVLRRDEDVDGQYEMLGDGGANGVVALWPVVQGCGDDEEIDVAVGAGVACGRGCRRG